jgi:hypothetical protein
MEERPMTSSARRILQVVAARWVGERVVPVGGVARDRRLLREAVAGADLGRVLVVGPSISARQALRGRPVDVVGTSPYAPYVTVCSAMRHPTSLPIRRWDTVILSDPGDELTLRLARVLPACRPEATLIVLDRGAWASDPRRATAIDEVARIDRTLVRGRHRLWMARLRS